MRDGVTSFNISWLRTQMRKESFQRWAFGDTGLTAEEARVRWNERHGELLHVKGDEVIMVSVAAMVRLWYASMGMDCGGCGKEYDGTWEVHHAAHTDVYWCEDCHKRGASDER